MEATKLKFEASFETRLMTDRLSKAKEDEVITYEELSEIIGQDVREKCYPKLLSARNRVLTEYSLVFAPVEGVGLKRLNDHEKVKQFAAETDSIRRKSRRVIRKAATVDVGQLDQTEKNEFNVRVSLFAALHHATTDKSVKQLAAVIEKTQQRLPLAKTLEAFK